MRLERIQRILLVSLFLGTAITSADARGSSKSKDNSKTAGTTNLTTYNPHDVVSQKIPWALLSKSDDQTGLLGLFGTFFMNQSNGKELIEYLKLPSSGINSLSPDELTSEMNVFIVHVVQWECSPGRQQQQQQKTPRQTSSDMQPQPSPASQQPASQEQSSPNTKPEQASQTTCGEYQPKQGAWAFYRVTKSGDFHQDFDLSGTPYLYNPPNVFFVDMNYFDDPFDGTKTSFSYSISTTPRQKQNAADLATLVSSLLKVSPSGPKLGAEGVQKRPGEVWGTVTRVSASSPLPYDLAITATAQDNKKQDNGGNGEGKGKTSSIKKEPEQEDRVGTNAQQNDSEQKSVDQSDSEKEAKRQADGSKGSRQENEKEDNNANSNYLSCDPSPCSFARTATAYDPEYWGVSLGVAIPGVMENVYPSTNSSGTIPKASPTRHIDAYAFFDLYLLQHFAKAPSTLTYIPHFNFGIPITSQSLHRPYIGMAENLSFLTRLVKLNIPLAVYAGPVFMKQQVYDSSTASLKWDHAIKGLYGLELPISAITNYLKSGSKGSNNSKSSNSANGGGS
jgi:hypothetical protein